MTKQPTSSKLIVFQTADLQNRYDGSESRIYRLRIAWWHWIWARVVRPARAPSNAPRDNRAAEEKYMAAHPEIWPVKPTRKPRVRKPK